MAGLLNPQKNSEASAPAPGASASGDLQDPILQQVERGVEEALPPEIQEGYNAIVNSGMAVMFSPETSSMMTDQLENGGGDIVANVSDGIAKLMMLLFNESKGQMQVQAVGPASIVLMCMALDFWEKTGGGQVDEQLVADATKQTITKTLEKFGITGEQLKQVIAAGQQAQAGGEMGGAPGGALPAQGGAQPQAMGV